LKTTPRRARGVGVSSDAGWAGVTGKPAVAVAICVSHGRPVQKTRSQHMNTILEMRGIEKTFPGVKALNNVNLVVRTGEIHAVVGENGAGKSTLMKVLSGVYPHGTYSGDIVYQGQTRAFKDIVDSESVGIIIIHQELALVPLLSITENLFLGNEQASSGVIDWELSYARAKELLAKVGLKDAPSTLITNLGVGKQQLIEIAKALSKEVKLLILDEPTASLNESDSDALLELLLELKQQGISSILISHKLNEISKVADSITVLRDGATVDTFDCRQESISEDRIIQNMVGREMADRYPKRTPQIGETIFAVKQWRVHHPVHPERVVIKDVDFHVRRGEIVGIAGLMGAGRTELAKSIFGRAYGTRISGSVALHGSRSMSVLSRKPLTTALPMSRKIARAMVWCWMTISRRISRWRIWMVSPTTW
jgi:putative multiple sugar transport system ATP-binding protein